jgi:lipopolysaccharide/colanic/teichoic acid biosynthesis glycosyltransferase
MEAHLFTQREILESAPSDEPAFARTLRRTADIAIAGLVLLITAPLLVALAAAIRLDSPGPALFRQRRVGHRMRPFTVFKFRTMRDGADGRLHQDYVRALISGDAQSVRRTAGSHLYKLEGDHRVTRIGCTLRRFSLDELPQLWNVLKGDMSLVGPRPVIPYEVDDYPVWYCERFAVKPGLTGLWQVSGRSTKTYDEMVRLDIEYVRRRGLALDARILLKTLWVVLRSEGAA